MFCFCFLGFSHDDDWKDGTGCLNSSITTFAVSWLGFLLYSERGFFHGGGDGLIELLLSVG